METLNGAIISYAVDSIGKEEIKGNQGFKDPEFDADMRKLGRFQNGWAWCVCFCEMVWKKAYNDFDIDKAHYNEMAKLVTPGAVRTMRNFLKAEGWTVTQTPQLGAIAIWQKYKKGKATTSGHAAIVESGTETHVTTIDGNTNATGGREGYHVARKTRRMNFGEKKGLVLLGFIIPPKF